MENYITKIIEAEEGSQLFIRRKEMEVEMLRIEKAEPRVRDWVQKCLTEIPKTEEEKQYISFKLGYKASQQIKEKEKRNFITISGDIDASEDQHGVMIEANVDRKKPYMLPVFIASALISLDRDREGFILEVLKIVDEHNKTGVMTEMVGYTSEKGIFHEKLDKKEPQVKEEGLKN